MNIIKATKEEIETLRIAYLKKLIEFQELYLELIVDNANYYLIDKDNTATGYAVITNDHILVEFYLKNEFISASVGVLKTIIQELSVKKIYCKSFDFVLLNSCLLHLKNFRVLGILFREYIEAPEHFTGELTVRMANKTDIPFLAKEQDGLFETAAEIETYVLRGDVYLFYLSNGLIGCGTIIRIHPQWDYYDLGMWVHPQWRKQGYALQIVSYLKNYCLQNNWKPICGCAFENIASQKTLVKSGFISQHSLLEFEV